MPPVLRPFVAVMLACFASGSFAAKKKPVTPPAPSGPSACVDFYTYANDERLDQLAIWR